MEKTDASPPLPPWPKNPASICSACWCRPAPAALPAGQIGERLGLPAATLSFHLNQLRHAGLVTFRREGRSLIYTAEYPAMNALLAYLTENCCQGDAAACGLAVCVPPHSQQGGDAMKRLHVHVSVDDLAQSVRFYSTLFAAEPAVTKPDYAKWMLDDPRVNFAISTRSGDRRPRSSRHPGRDAGRAARGLWPAASRPTGPCWRKVPPPAATPSRKSPGSPIRRACPGRPS